MTSVRDFDKEELYPKKVKKNKYNPQLFGVNNDTYSEDWPDTKNNVQLGDKPSLKMLYLDMKSREFVPQMMFTVGSNKSCNLYARVTAFTHSKGKSETTSHSEERSMSNAVSTKKIFVWEIAVPAGKIITPMQMAVDCDGSSVTIPWMNFRLQDEKNQIVEEYGDEVVSGDKLGIKSDDETSKDDNDYGPVKAISQQEKDLAEAFEQPPANEAAKEEEADEYSDVLGNEDDGKGKEKKKEDKAKSDEENVYEGFEGKKEKN